MAIKVFDENKVERTVPESSEVGQYVRKNVADETARATQEEQVLSGLLKDESDRAKASEQLLESQLKETTQRVDTVEKAVSTLDSDLSKEVDRATKADGTLQASLNKVAGDLQAEISRATDQEDSLQTDIDNESSRAKGAESEIKTSVSQEVSRATQVEGGLNTRLTSIEGKIPNQASQSNQLADKAFVNSSINSTAAFYRGNFATKAALDTWQTENPGVATNNDYAYIQADETHQNEAWRYLFVQEGNQAGQWEPQFRVNEAPFTAAQVAAIDSGITSQLVADIPNKLDKDASVTNFDQAYIKGANGEELMEDISTGVDEGTIAKRGTGGTLAVGTPLKDSDATPKSFTDQNYAGLTKNNSFTGKNSFSSAVSILGASQGLSTSWGHGKVTYAAGSVTYDIKLPTRSGIFALLSDVPTNYVTTNTHQTLDAGKTILDDNSEAFETFNIQQTQVVDGYIRDLYFNPYGVHIAAKPDSDELSFKEMHITADKISRTTSRGNSVTTEDVYFGMPVTLDTAQTLSGQKTFPGDTLLIKELYTGDDEYTAVIHTEAHTGTVIVREHYTGTDWQFPATGGVLALATDVKKLYRHTVALQSDTSQTLVLHTATFTFYSSSDTKINTISALKTLLGTIGQHEAYGQSSDNGVVYAINSTGILYYTMSVPMGTYVIFAYSTLAYDSPRFTVTDSVKEI